MPDMDAKMDIKILGMGCARCNALERVANEVVAELGLDARISHVTDMTEIMKYGVVMTPALVVDGTVKAAGRVPAKPEMVTLLTGGIK